MPSTATIVTVDDLVQTGRIRSGVTVRLDRQSGPTDYEFTGYAPIDSLIWTTINEIDSANREIRDYSASIRRTLDAVDKALDAPYHLNSLGEIQSSGPRLDLACAKRSQAITNLKHLLFVAAGGAD